MNFSSFFFCFYIASRCLKQFTLSFCFYLCCMNITSYCNGSIGKKKYAFLKLRKTKIILQGEDCSYISAILSSWRETNIYFPQNQTKPFSENFPFLFYLRTFKEFYDNLHISDISEVNFIDIFGAAFFPMYRFLFTQNPKNKKKLFPWIKYLNVLERLECLVYVIQ